MTSAVGFWLAALLLLVIVVGVLVRALWQGARQSEAQPVEQAVEQANARVYRDQLAELEADHASGALSSAAFEAARDELQQRLLEDVSTTAASTAASPTPTRKPWGLTFALAVLIPASALVVYALLGQPAALDPRVLAQGPDSAAQITPEKLNEMVQALEQRLKDQPNSVEGWVMLGRVQRARGLFDRADEALVRALALTQDDDLLIERAEVLAQKNGGSFAGEPWTLIQGVLTRDPQHLNALLLAGSASFAELNYRSALRFWERARERVDAQSPDAQELERAMAQAREKLGLPPMPEKTRPASPALSATSISGRVSLVKDLQAKVAPTDTVFIYATPVSGSKMPVAIYRTTADQLPLDFVLDDSMAMNPQAKLSDQREVTLRVRISKSGQAQAQPGDLGVSLSPVKPGAQGLNLTVREALR